MSLAISVLLSISGSLPVAEHPARLGAVCGIAATGSQDGAGPHRFGTSCSISTRHLQGTALVDEGRTRGTTSLPITAITRPDVHGFWLAGLPLVSFLRASLGPGCHEKGRGAAAGPGRTLSARSPSVPRMAGYSAAIWRNWAHGSPRGAQWGIETRLDSPREAGTRRASLCRLARADGAGRAGRPERRRAVCVCRGSDRAVVR